MTTYTHGYSDAHFHGEASRNNTPEAVKLAALVQTQLTAIGVDVTALQDLALNGGTLDLRVDALEAIALNGGTLDLRVDALDALCLNGGTLDLRVDALDAIALNGGTLDLRVAALESGRSKLYTFTGAGDQLSLTTTNPTVFVSKATVPANAMAVDDWFEYEAEVLVDGVDSTPAFTVKLLLGTAELDSQAIATAAAADGVVIRGHGRITAATTLRNYKGLGITKDGTLANHTLVAPADLTIQALSSARDLTVTVTSDAGHASNLVTLKSLRLVNHKAA